MRCLRRVFCWILVFLPLLLTAAERCAVCRRSLSGEVLKYKGELYCSIRCLKRVLPKCAVCGEPITGKYAVFTSVEGRKRRLCRPLLPADALFRLRTARPDSAASGWTVCLFRL